MCYTPTVSKLRRLYSICYFLFILALGAVLYYMPFGTQSPAERWQSFQPWFGPAPQELQAEVWDSDADTQQNGIIFVFRASQKWQEQLIRDFNLEAKDRNTAPLPEHWETQLHPFQPELTTWPKLMITSDFISGYDVRDMTLAQLQDGRILLAFHYRWDNEFGGRNLVMQRYDDTPAARSIDWEVTLLCLAGYAFCLVTPLGFLLLFPRYNLSRGRHLVLWFLAAALFPVLLLIPSFLAMHPLVATLLGSMFWLIIIVPLQLVGAAILLPLVMIIGFRDKNTPPAA
jgi:hypothetical protein